MLSGFRVATGIMMIRFQIAKQSRIFTGQFRRSLGGLRGAWRLLREILFNRRRGGHSRIMAHSEKPLCLLRRQINQFYEFVDQGWKGRVVFLGLLDLMVMLGIVKAHDLDESPAAAFDGRPVSADLLVDFKAIAANAQQCLANAANKALVLIALFLGDDVAVGL